jgi:hypothetical protein
MSAAPDLLEALEHAFASHELDDYPAGWVDMARSAIARAKGEE